ncbi:hypothetical protein CDAR_378951 [Caerostris darwini]|uniref:Uncharacterized protein n=1 Tax=Caerostris darwini TaxID=1538125 RepID=A0AAV4TZ79_9ARAC|nr:hypothetical protein CDAR_378951 [Caerostris darwini]
MFKIHKEMCSQLLRRRFKIKANHFLLKKMLSFLELFNPRFHSPGRSQSSKCGSRSPTKLNCVFLSLLELFYLLSFALGSSREKEIPPFPFGKGWLE